MKAVDLLVLAAAASAILFSFQDHSGLSVRLLATLPQDVTRYANAAYPQPHEGPCVPTPARLRGVQGVLQ